MSIDNIGLKLTSPQGDEVLIPNIPWVNSKLSTNLSAAQTYADQAIAQAISDVLPTIEETFDIPTGYGAFEWWDASTGQRFTIRDQNYIDAMAGACLANSKVYTDAKTWLSSKITDFSEAVENVVSEMDFTSSRITDFSTAVNEIISGIDFIPQILDNFSAVEGTGILVKTGDSSYSVKSISGGSDISVTNGSGTEGGDITLGLPARVTAGSYSIPTISVNEAGVITSIESGSGLSGNITLTGAVTGSGNPNIETTLGSVQYIGESLRFFWEAEGKNDYFLRHTLPSSASSLSLRIDAGGTSHWNAELAVGADENTDGALVDLIYNDYWRVFKISFNNGYPVVEFGTASLRLGNRQIVGVQDAVGEQDAINKRSMVSYVASELSSGEIGALSSLSTAGLIARAGAETYYTRTLGSDDTSALGVTNGDGVAGNPTLSLSAALKAFNSLTTSGLLVKTGTNTYACRNVSVGSGMTLSNANGIAGDITLGLDSDLQAVAGLTGTGIAVRTSTGNFNTRSILAGTGITVTNGTGVSGNITISSTVTGFTGLDFFHAWDKALSSTVITSTSYYKIAAATTSYYISGSSYSNGGSTNRVKNVSSNTIWTRLSATVSFETGWIMNYGTQKIGVLFVKNGSAVSGLGQIYYVDTAQANRCCVSIEQLASMAPNDYYEVWCTNETASIFFKCYSFYLAAHEIKTL